MRYKKIFPLIACLILITLLNSCSIEKRVYRKGYHVVWHNSKAHAVKEPVSKEILNTEVKEMIASVNIPENEIMNTEHKPLLVLDKDTCGDVLLLQNADEILAKILEIDDKSIKYKRCDNLNGPTYTIAKNKVAMIKYANGIKEVIQNEAPVKAPTNSTQPEPVNKYAGPKKTNMLGLVSFILHIGVSILSRGFTASVTTGLGLAGFISIALLAALVLAYASLFQFRNEPQRYSGKWMPLVVIGLDLAAILIVALILVSLGTFFSVGLGPIAIILLVIFLVLLGLLILALTPKPQPPKYTNEK